MTRIGVIGCSARAAVHSLARAGFSAWAVDQFADRDLKLVADCIACPPEEYPNAIPRLASQFPPGPVLYTGGLENYPHVIRELASQRELWGNPPEVLARVRDPHTLFPALAKAGFATPRLVLPGEACPADGRWLRKPLRSGGGLGIRFSRPGEAGSPQHYFQEFIDGAPMSAVYQDCHLLGITEQLIGEPWLHANAFAYCGNITPAASSSETSNKTVRRVGDTLAVAFGMRGTWGIDFILNCDSLYTLEVNPRYTAAVEVAEFWINSLFGSGPSATQAYWFIGKAIYYAPHAIRFPRSGPWDEDLAGDFDPWRIPGFADIPEPESVIESGSPVLTFFATGTTPVEVRERLQSRAAELDALFRDTQP